MKFALGLVALSVVLMSTIASAQWQPAAIQQVRDFNSEYHCFVCVRGPFDDPYWITLKDNIDLQTAAIDRQSNIFPGAISEDLDLDRRSFVTPSGHILPFRATYWLSTERTVAPLVVFLPGTFQGVDDTASYEAARLLLESGNHVLIIPNPLSGEYLAQMPIDKVADFPNEAEVVLSILRAFLARHQHQISSVELSGASYGSFIASAVLAKDSANPLPLITGQTTLLFSPFNMNRAVTNLDDLITLYHVTPPSMNPQQLIGYGFQVGLTRLLKRMQDRFFEDQAHGFVARQYPDYVALNFNNTDFDDEDVVKEVRFRWMLIKYIGTDLDTFQRPEFRLETWLEQARAHGNDRLRLLTTADDFLNDRGAPLGLPVWIVNGNRLLIRATGGHAGMVATPWFGNFILSTMRK